MDRAIGQEFSFEVKSIHPDNQFRALVFASW